MQTPVDARPDSRESAVANVQVLARRLVFASVLLAAAPPDCPAQESATKDIRKAVVKIRAQKRSVNLSTPWRKGDQQTAQGSGVWIGGGRLLTNAHLTLYSTEIAVQPFGASDWLAAKVLFESPQMDLALLEVDDGPFAGVTPPELLAELPDVSTTVQVYGYPTGGVSQSVTKGIVSRIDYAEYAHGASGLRIQVDAALNAGNSGGPAIADDKIVGLVFSRLNQADNIGYLVPSQEVRIFLHDVADGRYDGKARLLDEFQTLLNSALRSQVGLEKGVTGILVRRPLSNEPEYPLKRGDVITHIGDQRLDNAGSGQVTEGLRLPLSFWVEKAAQNGKVTAVVLRDGRKKQVEIPATYGLRLVIPPLNGRHPSYFVYGPLVLVEATAEYVDSIQRVMLTPNLKEQGPAQQLYKIMEQRSSPLIHRRYDPPRFEGEQLVMVSNGFLPHAISRGYGNPQSQVVSRINGTKITNLRQLVETLRDIHEPRVVFDFADRYTETVVFDRQEVEQAMSELMQEHGIVQRCSPDLVAIWETAQR